MSATSPVDTPSEGDAPKAAPAPSEPASSENSSEARAASPAESDPGGASGPTLSTDGAEPAEPSPEASPETSIDEIIRGSIDDALARWDAAFGIGNPEDSEAEAAAERDLEGFDARQHLAAASIRAVNRYLADNGLSPAGADTSFKPTPAFLAEHGVPLVSVVLGAVEQAVSSALTEVVHGKKPTQLESKDRIQLDLSDLFGPEEP